VKVKLDENLGTAGAEFLTAAGFDVATIAQQQLTSAPDENIVRVCAAEDRCLVTLDKDFSDPLR
jgi:predicted nuclease of predicted toxin-antitoxin system